MHTRADIKKINWFNANKVFVRKWHTLFSDPTGVYRKYKQKLKSKFVKLFGGIPPIYDEDYDRHWNLTPFQNKTVLDLGADYGSTAYYFLHKGAKKVIAVEGDARLASKLRSHFRDNDKVVAVEEFIDNPKKIETLISEYHPDLIKVDIEGFEKRILGINNIEQVNEWLIEAHSDEIYQALSTFLAQHNFNVESYAHSNNYKIMHAKRKLKEIKEEQPINAKMPTWKIRWCEEESRILMEQVELLSGAKASSELAKKLRKEMFDLIKLIEGKKVCSPICTRE